MGRHRRTSAEPARSAHGRGPDRRRNPPARTGLLGASAALTVGAVAVASGLVPVPGGLPGLPGGYALGEPDDTPGNLPQADGTPTSPAPVGGPTGPTGRATAPTSRGTARGTAPGGRADAPSGTAGPSGQPTPGSSPPTAPAQRGAAPTPTTSPPAAPPGTPGTGSTDGTVGATGTGTTTTVTAAPGGSASAAVDQVLALVNERRAGAGCSPLTVDPQLARLAQDFSGEMASHGFFGHTGPDGRSPWDRAASRGIANLGGENIARGQADAQAVMDSWMNSAGHRANILNCEYRTIGIGVDFGSGGPWWTQDFGF